MHNIPDNPYRTAAHGDLPGDFDLEDVLLARLQQLEEERDRLIDELDTLKGEKADLLFTLRRMRQIGKAMEAECADMLRECGEGEE